MKLKRAFFLVIALVFLVSFTKAASSLQDGKQLAQVAGASSQAVTGLTLVNAATNVDIAPLVDGYVIDPSALGTNEFKVRATTSPATVGSVKFNLNSNASVIRNTPPYVAGPNTLAPGQHSLTATPYTLARARGAMGTAQTVNFSLLDDAPVVDDGHGGPTVPEGEDVEGLAVLSFTLVDADTNQDIRTLEGNEIVDIAEVGENINIRANTTALPNLPGSVRFDINGIKNTINRWPFAVKGGDNADDYLPWSYALNTNYTIIAEPFELKRARGEMGTPLAIGLNIINSASPAPEGFVEEGDNRAPVVDVNDVFLTAPAAGTVVSNGQTLPMTCDITTAPDQIVWKLAYAHFYGNPAVAADFVIRDNLSLTTGSYTENVTIPASIPQGQLSLMCVPYFKNLTAPIVYTQDFATHNVTVGTPAPVGTTNSISITSPSGNSVTAGQNFTFAVTGAPTDQAIASVRFTASPDGVGPTVGTTNFGTDTSPAFSVTGNIPQRGAYNLNVKVTLTSGQVLTETKEIFVTDYAMTANAGSPKFKITEYTNCCPYATFMEDASQTINYTTVIPSGSNITFQGVDFYGYGGPTNFGGTGITYLGSRTAPNGTFTFTINEPGFGIGQNGINNLIIPIAFFSNTVTNDQYFVKVNSNPNENLPTIASAQVVNAQGNSLATLNPSPGPAININIGTQPNASTPLGPNISIKANPGTVAPTSAYFSLSGPSGFATYTHCEGSLPFSLFGDASGTYSTWPTSYPLGPYTLSITPHVGANCTGSTGTQLITSFVVNNLDDVIDPVAPAGLSVWYSSATEKRLTWSASTSTDETGYKIVRTPSGIITDVGNVLAYTDTTPMPAGSYYNVQAYDAAGNDSSFSNQGTPPTPSNTFAVGNVVQTNTTVQVKNTPEGASAGQQIQGKQGNITAGPVYVNGFNLWNVTFTSTPTLPSGWVDENGLELVPTGGPSVPSWVTTPTSVSRSESSVTVDWNASTGSVAKYQVEVKVTGGALVGTYDVIAPQTAETITGLSPVAYYDFKVRACDSSMNCSAWSPTLATNTWIAFADTAASSSAVLVSATTQSASPRVTLNWTGSGATTIYRKIPGAGSWGTAIGTSSNNQFQDTTAASGTEYEYYLSRGSARGYISSGHNVVLPAYNGKVVLLVEQNLYNNTQVSAAINEFKKDLKGEGWYPLVHAVSSTATPAAARAMVESDYNNDPANVKSVILIGRVPYLMSGGVNPDGHGNVPFPADTYFGDINGSWGGAPIAIPSAVELEVGRIDLSGMTQLGAENALTLAYFDKLHKFKTAEFVPKARGIIFDNLTWAGNYGESGWKSLPPLVGTGGQTLVKAPVAVNRFYQTHVGDNSWLWGFGAGGGANDSFGEGPTTAEYATKNMGVVFNIMFGSYFGNWTPNNNILRAPLGPGAGLTNAWASRPNWFFHHMGMGHSIGYSVRASMNNTVGTSVYQAVNGTGVHMGLMGDPTLRMNYFKPPTNLTVSNQGGVTKFDWTPSPESSIQYIYQINNATGTISAINGGSPIPGSSYTAPSIPFVSGSEWIIRAEKSITTPSGHYKNLSIGAYAQAGGGAPADTTAPSAPSNVAVSGLPTTSSVTLVWSASTGNPVGESVFYRVWRSPTSNGTYVEVGTSGTPTFTDNGLAAGTSYFYRVTSYDAVGNQSAPIPTGGVQATTAAAPAAPAAPTNLSGSASSSSQINLSWTDNATNEVTFTLERATNATFTDPVVVSSTISANSVSFSNTGLSAATTYYFRIKSVNATGSSAWVASAPITTPVAGGAGQVMGINGAVGPNNSEDITPGANPFAGSPNFAKDYYISSSTGDDQNNTGLSPSSPWKTIAKLNTVSHVPGNRVFFKRGDRFVGKITSFASGTTAMPIQYRAYGTGAAPVITGSVLATNWTVHSGNIWKADVGMGLSPKFLMSNGSIQHLAKTPNTGWLYTDSVIANSATGTVTDSALPAGSYVGAKINIRTSPWSWHAGMNITSATGTTLTYNNFSGSYDPNTNAPLPYVPYGPSYETAPPDGYWEVTGWAYMVQNKLSLLDSPGEWFYDSATGMLYFQAPGNVNPNTLTVELSKEDKAFYLFGQTDISIKNLIFENYTYAAIEWTNAKRITVENNEMRYSTKALHNYNTNTAGTTQANKFNNNYVHDVFTDGVWSISTSRDVFEGNVVESIGMQPEYGANLEGWNLFGFRVDGDYIVRRNHVSDIGYIGIAGGGSGLIEQNYITNAMGTLGDGGAISFDNSDGLRIKENIIEEIYTEIVTMPVLYGGYIPLAKGIYFGDHHIVNTEVDKNIVIDVQADAIWMDHGLGYSGNKVTNNTIYGFTRSGLGVGDYSVYQDFSSCNPVSNSPCFVANWNDVVTGNKVYGLAANQNPVYQMYAWGNGVTNAHTNFGTWNNNYYYNPYRAEKIQVYYRAWGGAVVDYLMSAWQILSPASAHDINSTASNYTLTDPNLAADIYYNATPAAVNQPIGTGGCTATGGPMASTQTIQPFSAVVVEHRVGGC